MFNKLIATAFLLVNSIFVNAALVDNGTFVTDTSTSTDYLKLSQTFGFSYGAVVIVDVLGFISAGWALTSQPGLELLAEGPEQTSAFTLIHGGFGGNLVITDASLFGGHGTTPNPAFVWTDLWNVVGQYSASFGATPQSTEDSFIAVSLSRSSVVPLPAAGYLFMTALVGLISRKRFAK